jgi:hypothetical protein
VLLPLLEVSPNWVHPLSSIEGEKLLAMILENGLGNQCAKVE